MKKVVWFVFFLIMAVSCLDEPDCFRQNINLMGISFKKMFDGKGDTVIIKKITAISSGDLIFVDSTLAVNVSLPLDYLQESTTFSIEGFDEEGIPRTYTLTVSHKSKVQFVSEDCGQRFIVTDLDLVSHANFDSIRLVSTGISNPAQVNINVYRCPRNNIMKLNFRQLYMDTVKRGKADLRTINSITNDGNVIYEDASLSSVLIVLDPSKTNALLDFDLNDTNGKPKQNTISFNYVVKDTTVLKSCGIQKSLEGLDTVSTDFPLLHIVRDSIYDPPVANFEILRCPITNMIKVLFKQNKGNSKVADTLILKSLTADYLASPIYNGPDTIITSYTLPLNPSTSVNSTKFSFQMKDDPTIRTLEVTYSVVGQIFHAECNTQPVYSTLAVRTADFTTATKTTVPSPIVKFPAVNNIEIILR